MIKVDTVMLVDLINRCVDFSMDDRLSRQDQKAYLTQAKRLRGHLVNLLTAQFENDTQKVVAANEQITAINDRLKKESAALERVAETVKQIAELVGVLDDLLELAANFV